MKEEDKLECVHDRRPLIRVRDKPLPSRIEARSEQWPSLITAGLNPSLGLLLRALDLRTLRCA
ncbi:hypothetical protein [Halocatena marina]|uniref:Uncharacterized protein n=1 Tax=Halocatena marina TaxID=2934937 RepID=A0ABD5YT41_9EURY|nr:hypothetical protein [Halocatena marina]